MSQESDLVDFLAQISENNPQEFKSLLKSLLSFQIGH